MCSTDVYRIHRVERDEPDDEEEKMSVERVCAEKHLQLAVVSLAK